MNTVSLIEHDIIFGDFDESQQTSGAIMKAVYEIESLEKQLRSEGKPVLILIHASFSNIDMDTRQIAVQALKSGDMDKAAVYGEGILVRSFANFLFIVAGVSTKVRYFEDKDAAESWLHSS